MVTLRRGARGEKLFLFIDLRDPVGTINERRYRPVVVSDSGMEFAIVCAVAVGTINKIDCSRAMQSTVGSSGERPYRGGALLVRIRSPFRLALSSLTRTLSTSAGRPEIRNRARYSQMQAAASPPLLVRV